MPAPTYARKNIEEIIDEIIQLEKEIASSPQDPIALLELKRRALSCEVGFDRNFWRFAILYTVMIVYTGMAFIFFVLLKVNISQFIHQTFGIEAPTKLVTLGIAGALLYLATSYLRRAEEKPIDGGLRKLLDFVTRVSIAAVVPIVLVVLFFDNAGQLKKLQISPELMSFTCGYSAKLVIDIFAKLVDKGSKMIAAI